MAVAEHPETLDRLTWDEICARYPNQFVCLIDVVKDALRSPVIVSARVVGHGDSDEAAFEPMLALSTPHPKHTVRFTGESMEPLIRPNLVIDDEALVILNEPFRVLRIARDGEA